MDELDLLGRIVSLPISTTVTVIVGIVAVGFLLPTWLRLRQAHRRELARERLDTFLSRHA